MFNYAPPVPTPATSNGTGDNDNDWEIYNPEPATPTGPVISITQLSGFGVNAAAHDVLGDWVLLGYNRKAQRIGFVPVPENTAQAVKLIHANKSNKRASGSCLIGAGKSLLRRYNLDPATVGGRYPLESDGTRFYIQLPTVV